MTITAEAVAAARAALVDHVRRTPLLQSMSLSRAGLDVFLKDETVQPTGSFKVRGAIHALASAIARQPLREVVAASTGNHGAAVAYAARLLGVPARVFVPESSNPVKLARIRGEGASLVETGRDLTAAIDAAATHAEANGSFFLHDASSPDVPVGAATIGAEIAEDVSVALDGFSVYVQMGDTALIRGVASALRHAGSNVRIVGVVAEQAPAYLLSWRAGTVVETATADTIADGLAVRRPLAPNVAEVGRLVDDVVAVGEREMLDAIVRLRDATGVVAEPSGAASLAALLRAATGPAIALITGGNLAPDVEARLTSIR